MNLVKAKYPVVEDYTVNVMDFGAVGDGVTDDTAAFVAAYNSAATAIIIPGDGKRFLITEPVGSTTVAKKKLWTGHPGAEVVLTGTGGFQVAGLGWGFSDIRFTPGAAAVPFAIKSGTLQSNRFSYVRGCEFRGRVAGHYFDVCVDLYNVWYSNFNDNYINQSGGADFSTGEIHGIGIRMSYCVNNSVRDNRIGSCAVNLQLTATEAPLGMMSSQFCCEGIVISGNTLIASPRNLDVREGYYIDVHDNVIDIPVPSTTNPVYFACMCSRLASNWISTMYGSVYVGKGESVLSHYDGTGNAVDSNVIRATSTATHDMLVIGGVGLLSIKGNQITFGRTAISGGNSGGNWNISDNVFSAQSEKVYDLGGINRVLYSNNKVYTTLPKALKTVSETSHVNPITWSTQLSVALAAAPLTTAGVVTPGQTFFVALPPGKFNGAPEGASATLANTNTFGVARYNKSMSSSTAVVFDYVGIGSPVVAGNYNFIITVMDTQAAF
ncbi:hypothetical protein HOQ99_gp59 [Klebsiella phage phiBO1E]|uniref:Pectate lyase superfamily protein domain-containing protein n=1 Tax=Klebsiella phage phiBO1E TaxID=1555207 RepID=A0A1U8VDI7_9CAUD|nr:hypothetical protein HOQ99_gp59 [Klebsiella phage phiBO1E]AIT13628.1 hypothetical protein BO1E_0059 [Klebsiella phage phiBO1E]